MADALTLEQKRALALASARLRLQSAKPISPLGASPQTPLGAPQEPTFAEKYVAPVLEGVQKMPIAGAPLRIPEQTVRGMVQGGADAPVGAAQFAANLVGAEGVDKAIRQQEAEYEAARGKDAGTFDGSRMGGNLIGPLALMTGGLGPTATFLQRGRQAAGIGAASGATNKVMGDDFGSEKLQQIIVSAILGPLLPGAWEGAKLVGRTARNLVQPLLGRGGAEKAAGRIARSVAGEKTDDVIDAMMAAGENVPGSRPIAGQASVPANSAEFAGLQKIAESKKGSLYAGELGREGQQRGARAAAIGEIAGTPEELARAKVVRKEAADPFYKAARSTKGIDARPVAAKIDKIIRDNPGNRELISELKNIRSGLVADAETGALHTDAQKLASVLDGMKAAMADEKNKFILGNLTELKDDLRALIPGMKQADAVFASRSVPINQKVVGAELKRALVSGTGKERETAFTNAVEKATQVPDLLRKTGAARYGSIDEVLDPAQMGKVRGVVADLKNNAAYEELAQAGLQRAAEIVNEKIPKANMLSRPMMIANAIMSRLEGRGGKIGMETLAELMLDPKKTAEVMRKAKPFERQEIIDVLMRANAANVGQQIE